MMQGPRFIIVLRLRILPLPGRRRFELYTLRISCQALSFLSKDTASFVFLNSSTLSEITSGHSGIWSIACPDYKYIEP